jgi:hypothetical protein
MYGSAGQVNGEVSPMLSRGYEMVFERTLEQVAMAATDLDVPARPVLAGPRRCL